MIYFHLKNSAGWNNPWFHFAFNFRKKCYGICLSSARGLSLVDFFKFSLSSQNIFSMLYNMKKAFFMFQKNKLLKLNLHFWWEPVTKKQIFIFEMSSITWNCARIKVPNLHFYCCSTFRYRTLSILPRAHFRGKIVESLTDSPFVLIVAYSINRTIKSRRFKFHSIRV